MPYTYSNVEYADIIFMYGFCNGNAEAAVREYRLKYPNRRCPDAKVFYRVYQNLRDTGCFPGIRPTAERTENQNGARRIVRMVDRSPNISTRRISSRLGIPQVTVWRTLKREGLHPYHMQKVQHLHPGDPARRLEFCTWIIEHQQLCKYILFTDEATFSRTGSHNARNTHWWSKENPKKTVDRNFQQRFSVNVWCGMIDSQLIGPYIINERLTGETYADFLESKLPLLLEDVPLNSRRRIILQQDGAPPHSTRQVTEFLNNEYPGRWIGRLGPHSWPPRSPDLTPLDFYLWGHLKSLVYKKKINSREELIQQIKEAAQVIMSNPGVLMRATQSVIDRARKCISANGGHFEHD